MFWWQEHSARISCCSFVFAPWTPAPAKQLTQWLVGLGLLPIWHSCWASGHLRQWLGSFGRMQKLGGTGGGKISDLQKVDEELCNCPFQGGIHWWTTSTARDGNMQEVPTSFPLCPLHYVIPLPLVARVKSSKALGLALGSVTLIFGLSAIFFC